MDETELDIKSLTPELCRELGIKLFLSGADSEERKRGFDLIRRAMLFGDAEAMYFIGSMMLKGVIMPSVEDYEDRALSLLCNCAQQGFIPARLAVEQYCSERYAHFSSEIPKKDGPLTDFDGKLIKINRSGLLTPIDVTLSYQDGENVLSISSNISFMYGDSIPDEEMFEKAVLGGISAWAGTYEVFGGQKLTVKIDLTTDSRLFDTVFVVALVGSFADTTKRLGKVLASKEKEKQFDDIFKHNRSFASSGLKWSSKSRKLISILSESFTDYGEIFHVAKHEFGHALGLGDLYMSNIDNLPGVEKGTFAELDSYYIGKNIYNIVMCDHHGPVSNNDIEMVVLAFSENIAQSYQPSKIKGKISKALGRGN